MISLQKWVTVKPLLYVVALLLALIGVQTLRLSAAETSEAVATAGQKVAESERDAHKATAEGARNRANGWEAVSKQRGELLASCQLERDRLLTANANAITLAQARTREAEAALKGWLGRYANAIRFPDCAAARQRLDAACPAMEY